MPNKSLTLEDSLEMKQVTTPVSPPAGFNKIYPKSDDKFYGLTAAGVESVLGSSGSAATPDYWQGYFDSSSTWSTTSASYADPTVSGSPNLVQRRASGLVVTAASGNKAGITFTPASADAVYVITASVGMSNTSLAWLSARLYDGTTEIAQGVDQYVEAAVGGAGFSTTMSGIYKPGTTSPVTVKIQTATTAGTNVLGSGAIGPDIEWAVTRIDLNTGPAASLQVAVVNDTKAQNTDGGTFTSGAWRTRDLNTVQSSQSWMSLSANQVVLGAGTYYIQATAPGWVVGDHQSRFQNITDSSTELTGTSEISLLVTAAGTAQTKSKISGVITIVSTKTFELQHQCNVTQTTNGFGVSGNFTSEIYSELTIIKLDGGTGSAFSGGTAVFNETQTSGTVGGAGTAGAWNTRTLNTVQAAQSWASLSGNQVTLTAGAYIIEASAPGYKIDLNKIRLRNITDSTTDITGTSEYFDGSGNVQGRAILEGGITISVTKTFEIQHYVNVHVGTSDLGNADSITSTSEVYSILKITKVL
jgi:hypothetical protein